MLFCICKFYKLNLSAPLSLIFTTFTIPERPGPHWRPPIKVAEAGQLADPPGSRGGFPWESPKYHGRIDRWIFSCGYRRVSSVELVAYSV